MKGQEFNMGGTIQRRNIEVPAVALALFGFALALRLTAVVWWQFDGLYGQDAFAYLEQGMAIAANLPAGHPPPRDFFWPNGYPAMVAVFVALLYPGAGAGQIPALLTGAALSPLAYAGSRALFAGTGHTTGLLAGLFVAVAGQPILSSISIMSDAPALFWAALATWLLVTAWHRPHRRWWLAAAGAALAAAIVTRWLYVLLAPAFIWYGLQQARRRLVPWWELLLPLASAALILLPQLALSLGDFDWLLHSWLLGWQPANALTGTFDNIEGRFDNRRTNFIYYALPAMHPAYLFPLFGLAACWAVICLWRQRSWDILTLLLGWAALVYLFLAGIPYQNFRYGLALYWPPLLLAAHGMADMWQRSWARQRRALEVCILLCLLATSYWSYRMLNAFLPLQNERKAVAREVALALPPDATLLTFGLTATLRHYTALDVREFYDYEPAALAGITAGGAPVYLLLDVGNVQSQWQGLAPDEKYRWLIGRRGLEPLAQFPPYTLFLIQPAQAQP